METADEEVKARGILTILSKTASVSRFSAGCTTRFGFKVLLTPILVFTHLDTILAPPRVSKGIDSFPSTRRFLFKHVS